VRKHGGKQGGYGEGTNLHSNAGATTSSGGLFGRMADRLEELSGGRKRKDAAQPAQKKGGEKCQSGGNRRGKSQSPEAKG